ncbi:hypothetical protein ABZ626_07740 [Streptomyces longispororuber]|uniref:hypothetical protein n=1 Tax=Streptomyces longispororuber TaxID=68230 RepID=UPI00340383C2
MSADAGAPLCWRCGQPIRPGERTDSHAKDSLSGAGAHVVWHAWPCPREEPVTG